MNIKDPLTILYCIMAVVAISLVFRLFKWLFEIPLDILKYLLQLPFISECIRTALSAIAIGVLVAYAARWTATHHDWLDGQFGNHHRGFSLLINNLWDHLRNTTVPVIPMVDSSSPSSVWEFVYSFVK